MQKQEARAIADKVLKGDDEPGKTILEVRLLRRLDRLREVQVLAVHKRDGSLPKRMGQATQREDQTGHLEGSRDHHLLLCTLDAFLVRCC